MEFVTFHSDRPNNADAAHPNVDANSVNYLSMIDLLFRSIRLFHPAAACTLLTDANTNTRKITGRYRRIDSTIDHSALMLSRSLAQMAYLEHNDFAQPIVLIDSDILLNAPLTELFELDFDIALTWRANSKMPINGGLLILNNRRPEIARGFFRKFIGLYRERFADRASWFGDQLALRDCVGMPYKAMANRKIVKIDGCKVLLLSCDIYNFSPRNEYQAICTALEDKVVLHFKGQRKRLMIPFFKVWLKPRKGLPLWRTLCAKLAHRKLMQNASHEANSAEKISEDL